MQVDPKLGVWLPSYHAVSKLTMLSVLNMYFILIGYTCVSIARCSSINCPSPCYCGGEGKSTFIDCNQRNLLSPDVAQIYLKHNKIRYLPHENSVRSKVWIIDISENNIESIERNQLGRMFPKLSTLDLSRNKIKVLTSDSFNKLGELNNLNLENNFITNIEETVFDNLDKLHTLDLAYNNITVLNFRWLKDLYSLNTVSLAHNKIKRIVHWKHGWPGALKYVHLNNNSIPVVPPIPRHVEIFNLTLNPLYCGCKSETFNISNKTLCKVSMKCQNGLVMELNGKCESEATSEKVYNMWKRFSQRPYCKKPVIKDLSLNRDGYGTPQITCVASGFPAPNIALLHNEGKQQMLVSGVDGSNVTSVTQTKVIQGVYICKASNYVDESTQSIKLGSEEIRKKVAEGQSTKVVTVSSHIWLSTTSWLPTTPEKSKYCTPCFSKFNK